jgi:hypothetical protein
MIRVFFNFSNSSLFPLIVLTKSKSAAFEDCWKCRSVNGWKQQWSD